MFDNSCQLISSHYYVSPYHAESGYILFWKQCKPRPADIQEASWSGSTVFHSAYKWSQIMRPRSIVVAIKVESLLIVDQKALLSLFYNCGQELASTTVVAKLNLWLWPQKLYDCGQIKSMIQIAAKKELWLWPSFFYDCGLECTMVVDKFNLWLWPWHHYYCGKVKSMIVAQEDIWLCEVYAMIVD